MVLPSGPIQKPIYRPGNGPWKDAVSVLKQLSQYRHEVAGNTESPYEHGDTNPGDWIVDDSWRGIYGHGMEYLTWVDPNDLIPTELDRGQIDPAKKRFIEPYIQWLKQGRTAPAVFVVETKKKELLLRDGHRRYLAAKSLGLPLLARISFSTEDGLGLTYELCLQDALLAGKKIGIDRKRALLDAEARLPDLKERRLLRQNQVKNAL